MKCLEKQLYRNIFQAESLRRHHIWMKQFTCNQRKVATKGWKRVWLVVNMSKVLPKIERPISHLINYHKYRLTSEKL